MAVAFAPGGNLLLKYLVEQAYASPFWAAVRSCLLLDANVEVISEQLRSYGSVTDLHHDNSAIHVLDNIQTPILVFHAFDDPVIDSHA